MVSLTPEPLYLQRNTVRYAWRRKFFGGKESNLDTYTQLNAYFIVVQVEPSFIAIDLRHLHSMT